MHRGVIKNFCQKIDDTQVEAIQKIQHGFGDEALTPTKMKQWLKCFKVGRLSMESKARSGRQSTSRNEELMDRLREKVIEDRNLWVQEIVTDVKIDLAQFISSQLKICFLGKCRLNLFPSCCWSNRGTSEGNFREHA